jgi:hypothetical protein
MIKNLFFSYIKILKFFQKSLLILIKIQKNTKLVKITYF